MIWFVWVLWHINHCMLFNAKLSLYIHIKYIWFMLVGFYGILVIVGQFIPNPLFTCILSIYNLVGFYWVYGISTIVSYFIQNLDYTNILNIYMIWFRLDLWYINPCRLFNGQSSLYVYIKYIWFGSILCHINPWSSSNPGALGNAEYSFIVIPPRSTQPRSGSSW